MEDKAARCHEPSQSPHVAVARQEPDPGKHFAQLFIETWKRIPLGDRRKILKWWRCGYVPKHPVVELLNDLASRRVGRYEKIGECSWYGYLLRFSQEWAKPTSEEKVRSVIAHELAHVYQRAISVMEDYDIANCQRFDGSFQDPVDEDADEIIAFWGFDPYHGAE
jgi:hypothetical protein